MKKLDTKVNVIPIIAKADTISKSELQKFKVNYFQNKMLSNMHATYHCYIFCGHFTLVYYDVYKLKLHITLIM